MRLAGVLRIWVILAALPLLGACQTVGSPISPDINSELSKRGFSEFKSTSASYIPGFALNGSYECDPPKCNSRGLLIISTINTLKNTKSVTLEQQFKTGQFSEEDCRNLFASAVNKYSNGKDEIIDFRMDRKNAVFVINLKYDNKGTVVYGSMIIKIIDNHGRLLLTLSENPTFSRKYASVRYLR